MKLPPARVASFLSRPDAAVRAVLVYGPDTGMVHERATALVTAVAGHPPDPFRSQDLAAADIKSSPGRLADEALSISFGGGRRVVRVRDGADGITAAVDAAVTAGGTDTLIVIDAGDLPRTSSLRQFFEKSDACAAIACYAEEGAALGRLANEVLAQHGMSADRDAIQALTTLLGDDRGETRRQLEVLALYMGEPGTVTLADVHAALGDPGIGTLEDLIDGAFVGDGAALVRGFAAADGAGIEAIAMLRFASLHAQKLWLARAAMAAGKSPDDAMKQLRPPVFFKRQPAFRRQLSLWHEPRLARALAALSETERACKTTGAPARLLAERALMDLAVL